MSRFEFLANFFHHFSSFLHTFSVTVTLTFDLRSPNSIGSEPVPEAAIQQKPRPNRCIHSAGILFTRKLDTQTHTQTNWSENITPPGFRGGVKIIKGKILAYISIRIQKWMLLIMPFKFYQRTKIQKLNCFGEMIFFFNRYLCDFSYFSSLNISHHNSAFIHVPPLDMPYTAAHMAEGLRVAINEMIHQVDLCSNQ